jgi:hypothetical protein
MSIPVALPDLAAAIDRYGDAAYVLTSSDDGRPHVAHVRVRRDGGDLVVTVGRRSRANAASRSLVSLLWPAVADDDVDDGFSLIVDATAVLSSAGTDADDTLRLTPTHAVLHRPAPGGPASASCATDCVAVDVAAQPG